ncbi:MAG: hypothetical protein IJT05_05780 [Lachnospiraceae bacterium]|nr:hypothetical protein [Lachnospiraceae bacterium]
MSETETRTKAINEERSIPLESATLQKTDLQEQGTLSRQLEEQGRLREQIEGTDQKKTALDEKDCMIPALRENVGRARTELDDSLKKLLEAEEGTLPEGLKDKLIALSARMAALCEAGLSEKEGSPKEEGEKLDRLTQLLLCTSENLQILDLILHAEKDEATDEANQELLETILHSDMFSEDCESLEKTADRIREELFRADMLHALLTTEDTEELEKQAGYDADLEELISGMELIGIMDDALPVKLEGRKTGKTRIRVGSGTVTVRGFEQKTEGPEADTAVMRVSMLRIELDSEPVGRLLAQRNSLIMAEKKVDEQTAKIKTLEGELDEDTKAAQKKAQEKPDGRKETEEERKQRHLKERQELLGRIVNAEDEKERLTKELDKHYGEFEKALIKKSGSMIEKLQALMNGMLKDWDQKNADEVYPKLAELSHKMAAIANYAGVLIDRNHRSCSFGADDMEQEMTAALEEAFSHFDTACPDPANLTFGDEAFKSVEAAFDAAGKTLQYVRSKANQVTDLGGPLTYRVIVRDREALLQNRTEGLEKRERFLSLHMVDSKELFDVQREGRRDENAIDLKSKRRKLSSANEKKRETSELWSDEITETQRKMEEAEAERLRLIEEQAAREREEAEQRRLLAEQKRLAEEQAERERLAEIERHRSVVLTLQNGLEVKKPTDILGRIDSFTDADGVRVEKVGKVKTFGERLFGGISAAKINERMDKHIRRLLSSKKVTDLDAVQAAESVTDGSGLFSEKFVKLCDEAGIIADRAEKTFKEEGDFSAVAKRLNLLKKLSGEKTEEEKNTKDAKAASGELEKLMDEAARIGAGPEESELPFDDPYYKQYPNAGKTILMYKLVRGIELSSLRNAPEKVRQEMTFRLKAAEDNLGRLVGKLRQSDAYKKAQKDRVDRLLIVNQSEINRHSDEIHRLEEKLKLMRPDEIEATEASFEQRLAEFTKSTEQLEKDTEKLGEYNVAIRGLAQRAKRPLMGSSDLDRSLFRKKLRGYDQTLRKNRILHLAKPEEKFVADQSVHMYDTANLLLKREVESRFPVVGDETEDLMDLIRERMVKEHLGGIKEESEIGLLTPELLTGFVIVIEQRLLPYYECLKEPEFEAWKEKPGFTLACHTYLLTQEKTDLRAFRLYAEQTMANLGERDHLLCQVDKVMLLGHSYTSDRPYVDIEKQKVNTRIDLNPFAKNEKELRAINRIARLRESGGDEYVHSAVILAMLGDDVNELKKEEFEKLWDEKAKLYFARRERCEQLLLERDPSLSKEEKEELLKNLDRYMTLDDETFRQTVPRLIQHSVYPKGAKEREELDRLAKRKDERLSGLASAAGGIFSPLLPLLAEDVGFRDILVADGDEEFLIKRNRLIERFKPLMERLCQRDSVYNGFLDQYLVGFVPRYLPHVTDEKIPEGLKKLQTPEGVKTELDNYYRSFTEHNLSDNEKKPVTIESELRKLTESSKKADKKRAHLKTQTMMYHGAAGIFDKALLEEYQEVYDKNVEALENGLKIFFRQEKYSSLSPEVKEAIRSSAYIGDREALFRMDPETYQRLVMDHLKWYAEQQQRETEAMESHMDQLIDSLLPIQEMLDEKAEGRKALSAYRAECREYRRLAKKGVSPMNSYTTSKTYTSDTRDFEREVYKRLQKCAKSAGIAVPNDLIFRAATEMLEYPSVAGELSDEQLLQRCVALYNILLAEKPDDPALLAEYLHAVMSGMREDEVRKSRKDYQRYLTLSDAKKDEVRFGEMNMAELMHTLLAMKNSLPDNGMLQGLYRDVLMRSIYEASYPGKNEAKDMVMLDIEVLRRSLMLYHSAESAMEELSIPGEQRAPLMAGIFDYFGKNLTARVLESERWVPVKVKEDLKTLLDSELFRKYIREDKVLSTTVFKEEGTGRMMRETSFEVKGIGNTEDGQIVAAETASFAGQKTRHSFEAHLLKGYGSSRAVKEYERLSDEEKLIAAHLVVGQSRISDERYSLSMTVAKKLDAEATVSESRSALIMQLVNQKEALAEPDYDLVEDQLFTEGLITKEQLDTDRLMSAIRLALEVSELRKHTDFTITAEEYEQLTEEAEEQTMSSEEKEALRERLPGTKETIMKFEDALLQNTTLSDEQKVVRYASFLRVYEQDIQNCLRFLPEAVEAPFFGDRQARLIDLSTYERESEEGKRLIESTFDFTKKDAAQKHGMELSKRAGERAADENNYEDAIREKVNQIDRFLASTFAGALPDSDGFAAGLEILELPMRERLFIYYTIESGSYDDPKHLDIPLSQNFYVPDPEKLIERFGKLKSEGGNVLRKLVGLVKNPKKGAGKLLRQIEEGRLTLLDKDAPEEKRNKQAAYLKFLQELQILEAKIEAANQAFLGREKKLQAVEAQRRIVENYLILLQ